MSLEEDHRQVGLALLEANANLVSYDTKVPDLAEPPYSLTYTRVSWPRDGIGTALDAIQKTITVTYTCHCVGLNPAASMAVFAQVRLSLLNQLPVIAGRSCSLIKQADAADPEPDESLGRLLVASVGIYEFTSTG